MQNDQRRIGDVLAADHHPLIDPAQTYVLDLRDAVQEHVAVWPAERSRVAKPDPAVDDGHRADEEPHDARYEPDVDQEQRAGGDRREPEDRARRQHAMHQRGHEQAAGTVVHPDHENTVRCQVRDSGEGGQHQEHKQRNAAGICADDEDLLQEVPQSPQHADNEAGHRDAVTTPQPGHRESRPANLLEDGRHGGPETAEHDGRLVVGGEER
jgi:hypothetical protein